MGRKWGVDPICKALQVAPSTYYQNLSRPLSKRALRDQVMMPILLTIFVANLSVYGARKLWIAACNDGTRYWPGPGRPVDALPRHSWGG